MLAPIRSCQSLKHQSSLTPKQPNQARTPSELEPVHGANYPHLVPCMNKLHRHHSDRCDLVTHRFSGSGGRLAAERPLARSRKSPLHTPRSTSTNLDRNPSPRSVSGADTWLTTSLSRRQTLSVGMDLSLYAFLTACEWYCREGCIFKVKGLPNELPLKRMDHACSVSEDTTSLATSWYWICIEVAYQVSHLRGELLRR